MPNKKHSCIKLPRLLGGKISTDNVNIVGNTGRLIAIANAPKIDRDRQAILSMVGEYKVKFEFEEFEPVRGYQPKPCYRSGAYELVILVEDAPERIVLQHLLVHPRMGFVIKHWRQDWHYEVSTRLEFVQDQIWCVKPVEPDEVAGSWTQSVYEVSDAPRYSGTGKWVHEQGASTWTSDRCWRPLPRREYSKRSDYNALNVVNVHRITESGWEHEQHNRKVVRNGESEVLELVKERGSNTYRLITGYDFGSGYRYWSRTEDYWSRIRQEWHNRIELHQGAFLAYPVDGMKMIWRMYVQSELARIGLPICDRSVTKLFDPWVFPPLQGT